ncbi:hypothetical protein HPC49_17650 [Pyxidicoccus fallax]|uniref:ZU5 domain-containing protein n=1 Tax=Pyxidicoccus fallax TaxID=394095 RepID=A0A848L7M1_9BACT|nr:hypothetical protein [Pyxidicoccus fallax]NMO14262.1 hypothetical protein [Pyxidicoccus fallax]NPC80037.1 hypothetical protein [Pyxidicoccus fallax]
MMALWLVACSSGVAPEEVRPAPVTESVDPGGKTVSLTGQATLQVAAGALTEETQVTLAVTEAPVAPPGTQMSQVLELTPHGTRFETPARVTLRYTGNAPPGRLAVLRLADAESNTWEPVGGARFSGGTATFDTTTFSYYVVTDGFACEPQQTPANACGSACGGDEYCASDARCRRMLPSELCGNTSLYVMHGELPDLSGVAPADTEDARSGNLIAEALGTWCGVTPTPLNQAEKGILDACTDAPLLGSGNTLVLAGSGYAQRLGRFVVQDASPLLLGSGSTSGTLRFSKRDGTVLAEFPSSRVNPTNDYFTYHLMTMPGGALVLQVYGIGWEGTPAGVWHFIHRALPDIQAGTATWSSYQLYEWTDDGDGQKGPGDTYRLIAQE